MPGPPARKLGRSEIDPPMGARTCSDAMMRSVSRTSKAALSRFCRAMATSAAAAIRSPSTFFSSSRTCASASDAAITYFSASSRARSSLPCSSRRARANAFRPSSSSLCAAATRRRCSASVRSISDSACFSSERFVSSVRCCTVGSNVMTTSPADTLAPLVARSTICRSVPVDGAVSTTDRTGRISPRSCRKSTNVVFVTSAVGSDDAAPSRRSDATATESATTIATASIAVGFFIGDPPARLSPPRDPASDADRCRRC